MTNKVLIVEDSQLLRRILHDAVKNAGYIAYEAENGRSALVSAKEIHPDLILLDVLMPVMDGMTMYEELRKQPWGKHIPVITLSSSNEMEVEEWIHEQELPHVKKDAEMVEDVLKEIARLLPKE